MHIIRFLLCSFMLMLATPVLQAEPYLADSQPAVIRAAGNAVSPAKFSRWAVAGEPVVLSAHDPGPDPVPALSAAHQSVPYRQQGALADAARVHHLKCTAPCAAFKPDHPIDYGGI